MHARPLAVTLILGWFAIIVAGCTAESDAPAPAGVARVHPSFSFSTADIIELVDVAPEATRKLVAEHPERFLDQVAEVLSLPPEFIVLVDKRHPLPADYVPDDLVPLSSFAGRLRYAVGDREIRRIIADDLIAMSADARAAGAELIVQSTYRSYAYQNELFSAYAARHGETAASMFSARPGRSQHQLGTAVDFAPIAREFAHTPAGIWLAANAWRYGFSLSYPEGYEEATGYIFEPWHFRYIGRPATRLERDFFAGVQQFMLEFLHERGEALRRAATPAPADPG